MLQIFFYWINMYGIFTHLNKSNEINFPFPQKKIIFWNGKSFNLKKNRTLGKMYVGTNVKSDKWRKLVQKVNNFEIFEQLFA
jgi:hypothetical protein